ncbi:AAA family ATPase [Nostoc sp. CENA67]|uniref:histidine kinase n=1 Tax=Amazonocrinis nigriterrae CENA67 TaxID=2794033 RepID=A0A8J7L5W8_9NOST|nr:ATP-binding sensor histidine kinase [Amazonocrinis nigriterrae]MBH8561679.1 AAA family ATPase [Amazonocrinis nigriterrae CENA67]
MQISGYKNLQKIHASENTTLYQAIRELDQQPVIIKTLKCEYPSLEELTTLKHEYEISKNLHIEGVVKAIDLLHYKNSFALILEYFGDQSIKSFLKNTSIQIGNCLRIILQVTETIARLHQQEIIHKDIKPENIIINPETLQVKITDFSIASRLSKENQTVSHPNLLEGTLAYISPEQTGRMNRSIDYRTDYYSLGVTFYEMLTGQLPYQNNDPMELVHCHIAKKPVPPHQLNPQIPVAVSDIVMKLLEKNAEDRYQSAAGIKYDLKFCLTHLETIGEIPNFQVGGQDLSGQLLIPQKLYGREQEVETLLAAFTRVSPERIDQEFSPLPSHSELMLVSGYSGTGKSSLVHEIHKPIVRQSGYFISGKFDQFKRNIPYLAFIQAFQELIQQLLTENSTSITLWKEKILNALGNNGQIIIDVIPELYLIIGQQPQVPNLGAVESQNRFNRVFQEFIRVFAQKEHPLVLFLDDLQWADSASLNLIQLLVTDSESQYLLLIGTYRDNEVSSTHPLMQTLEKIEQEQATINRIILKPLKLSDVNQLVADTLGETEKTKPIAELLFYKTAGNPFFLTQMFSTLYQEKLLNFDFNTGQWQWNISEIQAIGITDKTVVELVAGNIQKLPSATQHILKLAACIGNCFSLDVLAIVSEKSQTVTAADLWAGLQSGLILPLSNAYKIPLVFQQESSIAFNLDAGKVAYKFLHDRVQQAAYSLIPEDQKKETHLKIGRLLLANTPLTEREANIFDIVNQLNVGVELIIEQSEKYELAELNLRAAKKAKAATAYEAASKYINVALELLAENSWSSHYDLTLALFIEAVEVESLNANFEQSAILTDIVLQQAKSILDKAKVLELKVLSYMAQNRPLEAFDAGVQALEMLGLDLSVISSTQNTLPILPRLEDLESFPIMTDAKQLAIMRILVSLMGPVYMAKQEMLLPVVLTMINLCIKHGHSAIAAYAYVIYGLISCGSLEGLDTGYECGQIAFKLLEQFNAKELKCKIYNVVYSLIRPWKRDLKESIVPLIETQQSGLETGDLEYASYATMYYCFYIFLIGEPLNVVEKKHLQYFDLLLKLNQQTAIGSTKIVRQLCLNLIDHSINKCALSGEVFDEAAMLASLRETNNNMLVFLFYFAKLMLCYIFKDTAQAVENIRLSAENVVYITGIIYSVVYNFYCSLTLLAHYPNVSKSEQEEYLNQVLKNQENMKVWATHASCNFQHKYDLVEAEKARVLGQTLRAMEYYDRAIAGAKQNLYIQEEALANELAAEFYLSCGKETIGEAYLLKSYYGYIRWGAIAKVKDLEARYPEFISHINHKENSKISIHRTIKTTTSESLAVLDLSTVMKASQAISQEIVFDKLLEKLMLIVMENAGAQKGLLFLKKLDALVLVAQGTVEPQDVSILPFINISKFTDVPLSVINYVQITENPIVVEDAQQEGLFTADPYIAQHQIKSLLALPVIYQGTFTGIIYLENRSLAGAFTRDRLQVLSLLCAQIAISIENANLYQNLQAYSQQLESKNQDLQLSETREREKATQLETAIHQLQNTQLQLVHSEKMCSLGQMVAGIAHEVNNPINFIKGNIEHINSYTQDILNLLDLYQQQYPNPSDIIQDEIDAVELEFIIEDLPKMLQSMKIGANRISEIVRTMRNYSRIDATEMQLSDIHDGIDSTLMILQHRLKAQSHRPAIEIIKEYGNLPPVECYIGQLNQVFMNLLANGIDAIEESRVGAQCFAPVQGSVVNRKTTNNPQIRIYTEVKNNSHVCISISDNGFGMKEEVRSKIFNPFFTTKPIGKGTGIGLSISYHIVVEKHGGNIKCISAPGEGTEFVIEIPIQHQHQQHSVQKTPIAI